jgi:predicted TIM-barrel fold metal-dependent hydrolase
VHNVKVIDADSHLYETRNLWAEHTERPKQHLALRIADDEHGNAWLCFGDRRIDALGVHQPGDVSQSGNFRKRLRDGQPPEVPYNAMPAAFWDPAARLALLDSMGIDASIAFPNCGIMWESALADDLDATRINMAAWNRWAVSVAQAGRGRLFPVAHVTLRDLGWLEAQLRILAAGGVRLAMIAPALVDGRRLSHPEHERAWSAFEAHGIAPVFHIGQYPQPLDDAWNEDDPDWSNPLLSSVFMWTAPALALADLASRGVLARHSELRLGVVELLAAWVPQFLLLLDGGFAFHASFNGEPLTRMDDSPSGYIRRQVRVAAFPFERPALLAQQAGDIFMFGSDYPHPEGLAQPIAEMRAACDAGPEDAPRLYRDNAAWLLGLSPRG